MKSCVRCHSFAINHHLHGRDGKDGNLCDVCYWRKRAEQPASDAVEALRGLTERHIEVIRFALLRFINDAYTRAQYAGQTGPVENVAKFLDDAKTAEEARAVLAAADKEQR